MILDENKNISKKYKEIMLNLSNKKEYLEKYCGVEVAMIALFGSQNYELDVYSEEYQSDIDAVAICVPTLEEIIKGNKKISTTIIMTDNSHIDVHPDKTLEQSIQKRLNAMQEAETAKTEQQKVKVEMDTKLLQTQKEAEIEKTKADAEAYANKKISGSITKDLIDMKEAEARLEHGWVTVQGTDAVVTDTNGK